MNTKFKLLIFIALITSIFSSCYDAPVISGNNEIAEENRSLPNFDEVTSAGSFNIYYTHGDSTGVRIECESNLIPYLTTYVNNEKLDIYFAHHVNIHKHQDINIYVTSPLISKIELSGSGNIEADSVSGNSLELDVSGSGNIQTHFFGKDFNSTISGSGKMDILANCETVETEISGSGHINLEAFGCKTTNVTISGSGKAELTGSSDKATLKILGSGKISAYEFPVNEAEVKISGAGDVYVNVTETLDAWLSGSGNLHYIGSPDINSDITGGGRLYDEN
jgi:hypothetical protein